MRIIVGAQTDKFYAVCQLHVIVNENNRIPVIIDKHFSDYSLRSLMILNAPALPLLKESSKYRRNNVGIRRLPGQTWSQDVALSSDTSFFVIKYRELMAGNTALNTLRPRQNGRHFADVSFNRIFVIENVRISIELSPKFVPKGPINNIPALVQIMAWRRPELGAT